MNHKKLDGENASTKNSFGIDKKKITFYSSFAEQQAAEDEYARSLSPEERIRQCVQLIKQVYKDELLKNTNQKIITFRFP